MNTTINGPDGITPRLTLPPPFDKEGLSMGASRFKLERELLHQGVLTIAGVDEAGRGPLAGPVVASAVIFPAEWIRDGLPRRFRGLNDSKQLTPEQREHYYGLITGAPDVRHAVSVVAVEVIDSINIFQASLRAMNEALDQLQPAPEHTLVDGSHISSLRFRQTAVVQGDARSYSIAAASVVAKVTRDRLMVELDRLYPDYGFAVHKGYATPQHLASIHQHGPSPIHRRSFSPIRPAETELFDL